MIALQPPSAVEPSLLVQLGAWRTWLKAEETVRRAKRLGRDPPSLRLVETKVADCTWWRVIAGPVSPADAQGLCPRLSGSAAPCWTRPLRTREEP